MRKRAHRTNGSEIPPIVVARLWMRIGIAVGLWSLTQCDLRRRERKSLEGSIHKHETALSERFLFANHR